MTKSDRYLAMEGLLEAAGKVAEKTNAPRNLHMPRFIVARPLPYDAWFCRTHVTGCPDALCESLIAYLAEEIRQNRLPRILSTSLEDVPERFPAVLEASGFVLQKPQTGMLMPVRDYTVKPVDPHIMRINASRIDEWTAVFAQAFGRPRPDCDVTRLLVEDPSCLFYGYELEGKIVATLLMVIHEGNAGLLRVGTLEPYRGRGICKALLNRAFIDADLLGCPIMSLQASVYGEPVYRSIGMKAVSRIRSYHFEDM